VTDTGRHGAIANTALAYRRAGKNEREWIDDEYHLTIFCNLQMITAVRLLVYLTGIVCPSFRRNRETWDRIDSTTSWFAVTDE